MATGGRNVLRALGAAFSVILLVASRPCRAEVAQADPLPPPHLGYGLNVRDPAHLTALVQPLGFEWIKFYERYNAMPTTRLPYQVLYRIDLSEGARWAGNPPRPNLTRIEQDIRQIAQAGRGLVEAYEIGNEPNMAWQWWGQPPDPADYVAVLQLAYTTIKEVDPAAIVVSGGLGPVGRINNSCAPQPQCTCRANSGQVYSGNNCVVMDERLYARELFARGAGAYFDAFGYHPTGFAYEPERALTDLPAHDNGNGFAFRGAEVMRDIMVEYGLASKPMWATEFGWLRDPAANGGAYVWCYTYPEYENNFGWMEVTEAQQADYLARAFGYADAHWPWMGAMFVWNLDWHNQGWLCDHIRFFSIRKDDNTDLGAPAQAWSALAALQKRPGHFGPRLEVQPSALRLLAAVDEPRAFTATLRPLNTGYRVLTWTAQVETGSLLTPTLLNGAGWQGEPLRLTFTSAGRGLGVYTGSVRVEATTPGTLGTPQRVPIELIVVPEVLHVYLPLCLAAGPGP
jgi:hypothetical protein